MRPLNVVNRKRWTETITNIYDELELERKHYRGLIRSLRYEGHTESVRQHLSNRADECLRRIGVLESLTGEKQCSQKKN